MLMRFAVFIFTFFPFLLEGGTISDFLFKKSNDKQQVEEKTVVAAILPPANERRLQAYFTQQQTVWMKEHLLVDFLKRNADAAWLKDALEVMDGLAFNLAGGSENVLAKPDLKVPDELVKRAVAVKNAGCNDPLFCFFTAFLQQANQMPREDLVRQADARLAELLAGPESPHIKLFATAWLWDMRTAWDRTKNPARALELKAQLKPLLTNSLNTIQTPRDAVCFAQMLDRRLSNDPDENKTISQIHKYLWTEFPSFTAELAKPNIPPWLRNTLIGQQAVWAAWEARGKDWARNVKPEGWKGFNEQLEIATKHLEQAWQENPDVPFAAERMIIVSMGENKGYKTLRLWFDRSTAACFDYMPAYHSILWAMRPRWGGSHELMLDFGKEAIKTGRMDTRVPGIYTWVLEGIMDDYSDISNFTEDKSIFQESIQNREKYLPYVTTKVDRNYLHSWMVYEALIAQDYATVARHYRALDGPLIPLCQDSLYYVQGVQDFELKGIVTTQSASPAAGDLLKKAEIAYWKNAGESARPLYEQLSAMPEISSNREAMNLIRLRLAAIAVEQRMATGEWVKLSEEEHLLLWRTRDNDDWRPLPGGVLFYPSKRESYPKIYLYARTGMNFEVRAKMDNSENMESNPTGITIGYKPGQRMVGSVEIGKTSRVGQEMSVGYTLINRKNMVAWPTRTPVVIQRNSSIRLRVENGSLTFWVDEKQVLAEPTELPTETNKTGASHFFGFGSSTVGYPKGDSRLKDIEIRRLKVK